MELHLDHTLAVGGHRVRWGAVGDGPPLVLLHGTPFSSQVWRRIAPALAARRRVFYVDLLGYGRSDMPDGDVSLAVQNGVLAALFRACGLQGADVVAHDFGGATALRAHLLDGLAFRRLLLVDPVAIAPWGSPFVQHVRAHEAAFAGMPPAYHRALLDAYLAGAAFRPLPAEAEAVYAAPWTGAAGQAAFYRQIAQMDQRHTDAIAGRLADVACPTLILWGREDAWIPVAQGRRLAGMIPDARLVEVPEAGHLMQEDAPEAIVAATLEHLA